MILSNLLKEFHTYSGWGIVIIIILLLAISLFARKIIKDNKGHRYSSIKDTEKEMKEYASKEFVTKHKDKFVRRHHTHFYRAFLAGARWQRDKK